MDLLQTEMDLGSKMRLCRVEDSVNLDVFVKKKGRRKRMRYREGESEKLNGGGWRIRSRLGLIESGSSRSDCCGWLKKDTEYGSKEMLLCKISP